MLYIVCVLYNKKFTEIKSLSLFDKYNQLGCVKLIIVDNSDTYIQEENQRCLTSNSKYIYISCEGNAGLAKAYNKAYNYLRESIINNYYIMLSDDDTLFSEEYLTNVLSAIKNKKKIIAGIVKTNGNNFSPSDSMRLINKNFIYSPGEYTNIICINSGLVIAQNVLDYLFPINKNFFVDMIDYWIFYKLKKVGICNISIVAGDIAQSFSGNSTKKEDKKLLMKRFNIYKRDCIEFAKCYRRMTMPIYFLIAKRYASIFFKTLIN